MSVALGDFKYSEAKLASRIGFARADLKSLRVRHLKRDVHWKKLRARSRFKWRTETAVAGARR